MLTSERILLRDRLYQLLIDEHILIPRKKNTSNYQFCKRKIMNIILDNNDSLKTLFYSYIDEFRTEDEARYCLMHFDDISNHICPICDNICKFYIHNGHNAKYNVTCESEECFTEYSSRVALSEEVQNKLINTNRERYGCDYGLQNSDIREKGRQTCIQEFGVENPMQLEEVQERVKQTKQERYGDPNYNNREQAQETCLELYGETHPMKTEDIINKQHNTMKILYGHEHALQVPEFQKKAQQTTLDRYGTSHVLQLEEFIKKSEETCLSHYNVTNYNQRNINHYDIWSNDELFKNFIINQYNQKKMFLTLSDISNYFNVMNYTVKFKAESLDLLDYFYIQDSNLEVMFSNFLSSNNIQFERHNRSKIINEQTNYPYELDFYLPDYNIAFEINDINSHNSLDNSYVKRKDSTYHQEKSILSLSKDIRLIHIWEWELRNTNEWDRLQLWILNELNKDKIQIHYDDIVIIDHEKEESFNRLYNINDSYIRSDICLGLIYNNQLYQIMSFKKINDTEWQLIDSCTKFNYNIQDGHKILLESFIQSYNPKSIITYCDFSKQDIFLYYKNLNFRFIEVTEPHVIWCNKKMNHFRDSVSNNNINHYIPIYDSGNVIFRLII